MALERTAERFSITDWVSWVADLCCLIYTNWEEKRKALDGIKLSEEDNIGSVCEIWERDIVGSTGKKIMYILILNQSFLLRQ